jgi:hypothetical protein
MNKSIYAFAIATLLCASAAQAAVPAADPSVQVSSSRTHYKMFPSDFATYAGSYELTNGEVITLKQQGLRYYSEVDGKDRVEIFPVRQGVFASKDGSLLSFRDSNDTIVIDRPNQPSVASR